MAAVDIPIRYVKDDKALRDTIADWKKIQKEVGLTDKEIKKAERSTKELEKETGKTAKGFENLGGLAKGMAALFAADRIFAFTKQIIAVRGEFQKFEAVLANTLGSRGLARQALSEISTFAAKTPFQVDAVTGAFVKLANQGFVPTLNEMTKLGDLAASTGKDFDMLTEAIIDAQVGEFERLKEFGIRASKEGDNVRFTFKGVETQAKFTQESIRDYILSLGELEGVSGSMAAISETLEGKVSNLEDAWTQFMNNLGKLIEGPGGATITFLSDALNLVGKLISELDFYTSDPVLITFGADASAGEQLKNIEDLVRRLSEHRAVMQHIQEDETEILAKYKAEEDDLLELIKKQSAEYDKQVKFQIGRKKAAEDAKKLSQDQLDLIEQYRRVVDSTRGFDTALSVGEIKKLEVAVTKAEREARLLANTLEKLEADPADKLKKSLKEIEDEIRTLGLGDVELGDVTDAFEDAEKRRTRILKRESEKRKKLAEEEQEARARIEEEAFNLFYEMMNAAQAVTEARAEKELEDIDNLEAQKLALVGDNAQAQEQIRAESENKRKEVLAREARTSKAIATFEAFVYTATAVVKALSSAPPPFNFVLAGLVGAAGIAQQIAIQSQPIPKFKKGVKGVPGLDTGDDSVTALLRPGEWVIPTETSKEYRPALDAIFDRKISPEIMNAIALGARPSATQTVDLSPLIKAWKDNPHVSLQVNERGYTLHTVQKGLEIQKDVHEFSM